VLTDRTVATSSGVQLVWKRDAFTYADYDFIGSLTAADVEYTVMRTDLGSPVGSVRASNGAARLDTDILAFRHETTLDGSRRTYTYKIRARHFRQVLVASGPNSNTNYLRRVDVVYTYEDGCGETEFSITAPGPAPLGIKALAFPNSDPITNSCSVRIDVNWAPVPGATGYTVYNENAALGSRIPLTTLSFFYKQGGLQLSDLVQGALLSALGSDYTNGPRFKRGVNIQVGASFGDRPDSMSEVVPYTFSTYPCWDGLGDR
jgi:hypothetical protein